MKTAVRNVIGDLVEKRLWPVAVALIACIVAAPVVLGRSGAPAPSARTGAGIAAGTGADGAAAVKLAEPDSGSRDRAGRVRNPFGTSADATAASTPAVTTTATAASSPSSASTAVAAASAASASVAGTPAVVADSTASTPATTPAVSSAPATTPTTSTTTTTSGTSVTYSVAVRFGRTDGNRHTLRNIARLTALPNAESPVVSLLGVLRDQRTVVVKVAANTTAHGNGTCKPSASSCTVVEMKAGDAEYLRVAGADGNAVAWYYLKLLHVDRHKTTSGAVAKAARARRSAAGMAVVRKDASSVRAYRYLPGLGVLVRAKRRTGSAARTAAAGVDVLLPAAEQDGVPVWRSVPRSAKR